jgi:hypothetical protein
LPWDRFFDLKYDLCNYVISGTLPFNISSQGTATIDNCTLFLAGVTVQPTVTIVNASHRCNKFPQEIVPSWYYEKFGLSQWFIRPAQLFDPFTYFGWSAEFLARLPSNPPLYKATRIAEWVNENPPCVDSLGLRCGGRVGNRVGVRRELMVEPSDLYPPSTGAFYISQAQYFTMCTTPLCGPSDIDCVVAPDYGPWTSCFAYNGYYIKKRSKPILAAASGFGIPCPSEEERTQSINCTEAEQVRLLCQFEQITSIGECFNACGVSQRNVTVTNVTTTPLPACEQAVIGKRTVSVVTDGCPVNLPCSRSDPTAPTYVNCSTRGNAGYRGSNAAYVQIDFDVDLLFTGNVSALASRFTVKNTVSGRLMSLAANQLSVHESSIRLWFIDSPTDMDMSTGAQFSVYYSHPNATLNDTANDLRTANDETFQSFICTTVDRSPPVLVYAVHYLNGENVQLLLTFSEVVQDISGNPNISPSGASETGFESNPFGEGDFMATSPGIFFSFQSFVPLVSSSPTLALGVDTFMDVAENPNTLANNVTIVDIDDMTSVIPADASDSIKFYLTENSQLLKGLYIPSVLPLLYDTLSDADNSYAVFLTVRYAIAPGNQTIQSTQILFEQDDLNADYWINSVYVAFNGPASLLLNTSSVFETQSMLGSDFQLSSVKQRFLVQSTSNPTVQTFAFGTGYAIEYNGTGQVIPTLIGDKTVQVFLPNNTEYRSTNRLVSAFVRPTSTDLRLIFSADVGEEEGPTLASYVQYQGINSIVEYASTVGTVVTVTLRFPFTYSMFDTDYLLFFQPNGSSSVNPAQVRTVISNSLGPRPMVFSALLSRVGTLFLPNRLVVTYTGRIGTFGVSNILQDSIKFNWTNPLISAITATDYSISGAVITYTISVTCRSNPCINMDLGLRVSARGMIDDNGNLASLYENVPVIDVTSPQISSSTELIRGVVTVTLSKDFVATAQQLKSAIRPTPTTVSVVPDNTAFCVFEQDFCEETRITVDGFGGAFTDLNENPTLLESFPSQCSTSSGGSCSLIETGLLAAVIVMSLLAPVLIAGNVLTFKSIRVIRSLNPS